MSSEPLQLLIPDLIGVFVFALAGGLAAVRARLDLFGVLVLAAVTALGGGILRDISLGLAPPNALRHWPYIAAAGSAGLVVFWLHPQVERLRLAILGLDAAGLGLFTVTGTKLALESGLGVVGSCAIGLVAGVGGSVIRDVLLREIPVMLRRELYALSSLTGAIAVCGFYTLHRLQVAEQIACSGLVVVVRLVSVARDWSAPVARLNGQLNS